MRKIVRLRALITRFVLHNWGNVSGDALIDIGDMNIERRLLQMARPISAVLKLFPDGEKIFRIYITKRQDEVRRTRADSWEGSIFNQALSIAIGDNLDKDTMPDGITSDMVAELTGLRQSAITKSLKSIGFETEYRAHHFL